MMPTTAPKSNLLGLPPEIRNNIYSFLLQPSASRKPHPANDSYTTYDFRQALNLYYVNKQIHQEARAVFYALNTFVLIETPWAQALRHVARDGRVPIVATGQAGWTFDLWSLKVVINAPQWSAHGDQYLSFAIHVDDLPKFAATWRYSDLTEPLLNPQLSLGLQLRDPMRTEQWQEPVIPKAVQQRLLLPFTIVKRLHSVTFEGDLRPNKSVEKELMEGMQEPHETPESCLRRATQFKEAGNAALKAGKYNDALQLYTQAWTAMHIVVHGREREIHADAFFNKELKEPPFQGMQGHTVRLALRVKLVANTVMLYLKMGQYEVCRDDCLIR